MALKEFPRITLSVSSTTRPMRPYEKEGVHYHFLSEPEFQKKVDQGEFAEWAVVHNHRYGTSKEVISRCFQSGKHVLFDIDIQGAMSLLGQYPTHALLIFINPPSMEALAQRLEKRQGDSRQSIETRLQNAYTELEWRKHFDYQITNDELGKAYAKLKAILEAECP